MRSDSVRPVPDTEPPAPRPAGAWRIGTLGGADVLIQPTTLILIGLLAMTMAPVVEQVVPGLGPWRFVVGAVYAVVLYAAVLLHEASHAAMARRYGYRVDHISLSFLGGATALSAEAKTPAQEFWIAVVGPITSIAIGLAALAASLVVPEGVISLIVEGMAFSNLVIGVLNLVPGLPLDGGRVLKSAVWKASGNVHRGTIVAAWGGRVAAVLMLAYPLLVVPMLGRTPGVLSWVLAAILAMFLWTGATAAMTSARLRRRLPSLVARRLARRTLALPDSTPLAEAVRRAQQEEAGAILTLASDGRAVGLVNEAALLAVPEDRRPWLPVSAVARTLGDGLTLPADLAGEDLVRAMGRRPAEEYLLTEPDGSVMGVLATADVDRAFRESR